MTSRLNRHPRGLCRPVLVMAIAILLLSSRISLAWTQEAHKQINFHATNTFFSSFASLDKYRLGPIDAAATSQPLKGIAVLSSSTFVDPVGPFGQYLVGERLLPLRNWIVMGGDWADEPHLYASVRHFYDPLKMSGEYYLTDQSWAHGTYDAPGIDAKTWGLTHPDNPFSFAKALHYYKRAMEISESATPTTFREESHFKLDMPLVPSTLDEERNIYLALAYRALGESMHMLADMVQPAHVRNDSHPLDEPIEDNTFSADVDVFANAEVDWRIGSMLASAGGELMYPDKLFTQVALFTNQSLLSNDTIDAAYYYPSLSELKVKEYEVESFRLTRKVKVFFAPFVNDEFPLAQERLSFHWFDPDQATLSRIGRLGTLGPYHVPGEFAEGYAEILMPIAIHANADLMHMFYPTMELRSEYYETEQPGASGGEVTEWLNIDGEMIHRVAEDPAWRDYGLSISYCGPGELVFATEGKVDRMIPLEFLNGKVQRVRGFSGAMTESPLRLRLNTNGEDLSAEDAYLALDAGQSVFLRVRAGSRIFDSAAYDLKPTEPRVVIQPRTAIGKMGATFSFSASTTPRGYYRLDWDLGDGNQLPAGQKDVSHVYGKPGEYNVTVEMYDKDGNLLAEDTARAIVEERGEASVTVEMPNTISGIQPFEVLVNIDDPVLAQRTTYIHVEEGNSRRTLHLYEGAPVKQEYFYDQIAPNYDHLDKLVMMARAAGVDTSTEGELKLTFYEVRQVDSRIYDAAITEMGKGGDRPWLPFAFTHEGKLYLHTRLAVVTREYEVVPARLEIDLPDYPLELRGFEPYYLDGVATWYDKSVLRYSLHYRSVYDGRDPAQIIQQMWDSRQSLVRSGRDEYARAMNIVATEWMSPEILARLNATHGYIEKDLSIPDSREGRTYLKTYYTLNFISQGNTCTLNLQRNTEVATADVDKTIAAVLEEVLSSAAGATLIPMEQGDNDSFHTVVEVNPDL
jgi:hypothetical protein